MVKGYIVEFHKIGPLEQMIAKNQRYGAKEGTPLALAAAQSFTDSLLGSATVASQPDPKTHAVLIEANGLFLADIAADSTQLEAAYRAPYSFDQRNSSLEKGRATADRATFPVSAPCARPKSPAPPQPVNPANPLCCCRRRSWTCEACSWATSIASPSFPTRPWPPAWPIRAWATSRRATTNTPRTSLLSRASTS